MKYCSLLIIIFLTFLSSQVFADSDPREVVQKVILAIQDKGDPSPVVDYLNWEANYKEMSEKGKSIMGVTSPLEFKEFYRRVLISPAEEMVKVFEYKFKDQLGTEKSQAIMKAVEQNAIKKEAELKEKILNTTYEVGEANIEGDEATVILTHTYKGESKTDKVKLSNYEGKWFLSGFGTGFSLMAESK